MDVQGSELSVLKGLGVLISNVKVIVLETSFSENYIGGSTFNEILEYLVICGFRFVYSTFDNSDKIPKAPIKTRFLKKYTPDFNCLFVNNSQS